MHGVRCRSSPFSTGPIEDIHQDPHVSNKQFYLHYCDLTGSTNRIWIAQAVQPEEVCSLAAQRHVEVSFRTHEYTASADAIGTLRLLKAIRIM